jgi:hypothetical protein
VRNSRQFLKFENQKQILNLGRRFAQMHTDSKTNKAHRLRREKKGKFIPAYDAALHLPPPGGAKIIYL